MEQNISWYVGKWGRRCQWFNKDLSDDYILNRLNCLYDEEFSDNKLSNERAKELNLIDNILSKHK